MGIAIRKWGTAASVGRKVKFVLTIGYARAIWGLELWVYWDQREPGVYNRVKYFGIRQEVRG